MAGTHAAAQQAQQPQPAQPGQQALQTEPPQPQPPQPEPAEQAGQRQAEQPPQAQTQPPEEPQPPEPQQAQEPPQDQEQQQAERQQPQQAQQPSEEQEPQPPAAPQPDQPQQAQQQQPQPPGEPGAAQPAPTDGCAALPGHGEATELLRMIVSPGDKAANGGLGNHVWATLVDREGTVCAVTRSGEAFGDQWLGSRAVSASKAFTANAFSLPEFALSTANLYWPAQPGNGLYGMEAGHPLEVAMLHAGGGAAWGTPNDPVTGERLGGTTVFAGGLALYDTSGELVGGLGVSGDQSCTDHVIAWKLRHELNLDNVPDGVTSAGNDNIIHDLTTNPATGQQKSASGYGHPACGPRARSIAERFMQSAPTGPEA